ncbi:hypothetical protein D9615_001630 [Tricholomella constricta]|uniref:Uncharacterized protein n=1 Tax=Tricholomella constricta TaxID=117010 RepID=A0A8H5HPJ1_9AGAR|nr:hypothetical protein D9615_001630 [Tricholomella constricta]
MSSGATAQDKSFKSKEQAEEARYIREKEKAQLAAIRQEMEAKDATKTSAEQPEREFEGGFGGQEDLEDRYASTSGEH